MLPEIEAYFAAVTITPEQIREKLDAIAAKYREDYGTENNWSDYTFRNYRDACQQVNSTTAREVRRGAWDKLKESEDPLVRYIAENLRDFSEHAEEVFKILPATLDELDQLAAAKSWCSDWDRYVRAAQRAGVLPEAESPTEAEKALYTWFGHSVTSDRAHRRTLKVLVRAVVAEALAAATATEDTAEKTDAPAHDAGDAEPQKI
jgi:hypothetical protein